ncbi:MAG: MATE family efflux transporter [Lysobacterales bacterium]
MAWDIGTELREEFPAVLRLALPVVLGQLFIMGVNVADTMLAGQHSPHALGVVAVAGALWSLVLMIVLGFLYAVPPLVAAHDGAGRRERIASVVSQALWLGLAISAILFVAVRFVEHLLIALRVDAGLIDDAARFLRTVSYATPALSLFLVLRYLSEGIGYTRATLYFSALGVALFVPIGWLLVFGHWGLPALGAQGCAIALTASLWLQALAFVAFVARHPVYHDLQLGPRFEGPRWSEMKHLLELALPIAMMVVMEGSMFVLAALLVASIGTTAVASHQIAVSVGSVAFMVPLGIGAATTVRVGRALGAGDGARLRAAAKAGLLLALAAQFLLASSMALWRGPLAALYSGDAAVAALATQLLLLCAVFQFSDGLQAVAAAALRGLQDVRVPALLTLIAYWLIGLGSGHWLAFERGLGAPGMWWGLAAGLTAAALFLMLRLRSTLARHAAARTDASGRSGLLAADKPAANR